jgi:hypothetical protein
MIIHTIASRQLEETIPHFNPTTENHVYIKYIYVELEVSTTGPCTLLLVNGQLHLLWPNYPLIISQETDTLSLEQPSDRIIPSQSHGKLTHLRSNNAKKKFRIILRWQTALVLRSALLYRLQIQVRLCTIYATMILVAEGVTAAQHLMIILSTVHCEKYIKALNGTPISSSPTDELQHFANYACKKWHTLSISTPAALCCIYWSPSIW